MSVTAVTVIRCDTCGDRYVGRPVQTPLMVRASARAAGWTGDRHGHDICPACGRRPQEVQSA